MGNHHLAMDATFIPDNVVQHLTKSIDCHQLKTVIIPIYYTIITHYYYLVGRSLGNNILFEGVNAL